MDFWGFYNFNFGFGANNWFVPTFTLDIKPLFGNLNTFPPCQFPTLNFTPSLFGNSLYTPDSNSQTPAVTTNSYETKPLSLTRNTNNSLAGYNASAGQKLAYIALNNSAGWKHLCATYVKNAIQDANMGEYKYGDAYKMSSILRDNKNFKEISADSIDVKDLPAGCVLVYDKGAQGYSKNYGHTEITTGDGRAVSDGITQHLHKKPSAVFIPVEHNYLA